MKRLLVGLMVLGFAASLTAYAEGEKAAPKVGDKPALKTETLAKDITVTGKLSKEVKKEGDKEKVKYIVTTADGQKVILPEVKLEGVDLAKLDGKEVKVVGTGKDEGKKVHLKTVTAVTEAVAPAKDAAAAPAKAAPAKDLPAPAAEVPVVPAK